MSARFLLPWYGRFLGAIAWLVVCAHPSPARAQDTSLAYAVKATYLYKFAPFVEWPNDAAAYPAGAFTICLVGNNGLGDLLQRLVQGQQVSGHPIMVRRFASLSSDPGCSELYAGGTPAEIASDLAAVRGAPVLTVTDGAGDPAATGIINFVLEDGHVRFDINNAAAASAGLAISSKLLSLAVHVTERNR